MIYYWARGQDIILMLLAFGKNEQADLTSQQRSILKRLVEEEFK